MSTQATAAVTFAKRLLAAAVSSGDVVVDATAGGGNDAVFLAGLVAPHGVVHCFDIQAEALARTRQRLDDAGLAAVARLHGTGHENLRAVLPGAVHGLVRAVVFNLGFLPRGDETIVTRPETTLAALEASREVLAVGGVIAVACYTGHPGGTGEAGAVEAWCAALPFADWRAARYELVNKPGAAIRLFFLEKRA